jgi:hypothetical protein
VADSLVPAIGSCSGSSTSSPIVVSILCGVTPLRIKEVAAVRENDPDPGAESKLPPEGADNIIEERRLADVGGRELAGDAGGLTGEPVP